MNEEKSIKKSKKVSYKDIALATGYSIPSLKRFGKPKSMELYNNTLIESEVNKKVIFNLQERIEQNVEALLNGYETIDFSKVSEEKKSEHNLKLLQILSDIQIKSK